MVSERRDFGPHLVSYVFDPPSGALSLHGAANGTYSSGQDYHRQTLIDSEGSYF